MIKVATVVGTRPEVIKLSRTIAALDRYCKQVLVHTGQNYDYELNQVFFDELGIRKPDFFLDAAGGTACSTIANVLLKSEPLLKEIQPDAVLVLGDTNSAFAALVAKKLRIPVFHMEAGNRSYDERVPEEVNRRVIDHLSDVNLVYTENARRCLAAEGLPSDRVIKTGSPMREVLVHHAKQIDESVILSSLNLQPQNYFVVSAHREENVDDPANLRLLAESLTALGEAFQMPLVFSVHPRTRQRIESTKDISLPTSVIFSKPLGFLDYVKLQKSAFCVVSDSGTVTEESAILSFPAITIRNAHERPEGMDVGTLIMSGLTPRDVVNAVRVVTRQAFEERISIQSPDDYQSSMVSAQVVRLMLSYTGFVNRVVWRKP